MKRILTLWGVPRSTSTAFEWMMRMRGDLSCWHEPFGEAWYHGEDRRWPRATSEDPVRPGLTFESVWERLRADAEEHDVFVKDFPHYTRHMWSDAFLAHFRHSFLVRDPAKVLTSMHSHWPEFLEEETGFREQRELFDRIAQRDGTAPPVIDSDDLLEDPETIVAAYCSAMGIPFIREAMTWEPGDRAAVSWYDGGSWHGNLRSSDGLKPQRRREVDLSKAPDWLRRMHDRLRPHYDAVAAHRITGVVES